MADQELPEIDSIVRIKADANGSGALARGELARVISHSTSSYGMVKVIDVELINGPNDNMKKAGIDIIDLYPNEFEIVPLPSTGAVRAELGRLTKLASDLLNEPHELSADWAEKTGGALRSISVILRQSGI